MRAEENTWPADKETETVEEYKARLKQTPSVGFTVLFWVKNENGGIEK